MSFQPIDPSMLQASLEVFKKVSGLTNSLVATVFIARVTILVSSASATESYGKLLKDLVLFFVVTALFPQVFKIVVNQAGSLSLAVGQAAKQSVPDNNSVIENLLKAMKAQVPVFGFVTDILPLSITYIAQSIFSVVIGLLCAIAPLILLSHFITGSVVGFSHYISTLIILCLWPVLWNVLGLLKCELAPTLSHTSLSSFCFALVIQVLQLFSPLLLLPLFKFASLSAGLRKAANIKTLATKGFKK